MKTVSFSDSLPRNQKTVNGFHCVPLAARNLPQAFMCNDFPEIWLSHLLSFDEKAKDIVDMLDSNQINYEIKIVKSFFYAGYHEKSIRTLEIYAYLILDESSYILMKLYQ